MGEQRAGEMEVDIEISSAAEVKRRCTSPKVILGQKFPTKVRPRQQSRFVCILSATIFAVQKTADIRTSLKWLLQGLIILIILLETLLIPDSKWLQTILIIWPPFLLNHLIRYIKYRWRGFPKSPFVPFPFPLNSIPQSGAVQEWRDFGNSPRRDGGANISHASISPSSTVHSPSQAILGVRKVYNIS